MMNNCYVIGDIETGKFALDDAIEIIQNRKNEKLIFLGDIYCANESEETIKNINQIMDLLKIEKKIFIDKFENLNDCAKIIEIFQKLYLDKHIDVYSGPYKFKKDPEVMEYLKSELEELNKSNPENIFLFGNKETAIINDFRNVKGFNLLEINNEKIVEFRFQYNYKHISHEARCKFSCKELNILINYLYMCHHIFYINKTLLSHIYLNAKRFSILNPSLTVNQVICGHNRCFGRYFDQYSKINYGIYLIDISHDDEHLIKNYLYLSPNEIKFYSLDKRAKEVLSLIMPAKETFLQSFDSNPKLIPDGNIGAIYFRSSYLEKIKNGHSNE